MAGGGGRRESPPRLRSAATASACLFWVLGLLHSSALPHARPPTARTSAPHIPSPHPTFSSTSSPPARQPRPPMPEPHLQSAVQSLPMGLPSLPDPGPPGTVYKASGPARPLHTAPHSLGSAAHPGLWQPRSPPPHQWLSGHGEVARSSPTPLPHRCPCFRDRGACLSPWSGAEKGPVPSPAALAQVALGGSGAPGGTSGPGVRARSHLLPDPIPRPPSPRSPALGRAGLRA